MRIPLAVYSGENMYIYSDKWSPVNTNMKSSSLKIHGLTVNKYNKIYLHNDLRENEMKGSRLKKVL